MKLATTISILLLLFSCAHVKQSMAPKQVPSAIPVLRITNDTTAAAIKISSLTIDVNVVANIATTTYDIVFYNPNNRILEGELEFPLADGQHIVRYALDTDGKLREGVVVEKAKARVAFENTIRQNIDPGLVEKTRGNNFRTRVYPLPAQGTRHIVIATEQALEQLDKDLFYQLPLFSGEPIDNFSIKASVVKSSEKPVMEETGLTNFKFEKWQALWQAAYSKSDFIPNQTIAFTIPNSRENENLVLTENYNGQSYFYANSRIEPAYKKKNIPKTIGVLWDISSSGEKRDIEKEKQLLKTYLSMIGDVKLSLIPFNISIQSNEIFNISSGDSEALLKKISELKYDGGTQFGAIDLGKYSFDEVLLFTDGLGTFGRKEINFSNIPVTTISSSPSADFSFLKFVAQHTHGKFIDLTKLETKNALDEVGNHSLQIVNVEYNPAEIEAFVTQVSPVRSSGLSFSGKLKANTAVVKINLGFGTDISSSKAFTITRQDSSGSDQVKRIWASMKIEELDLQFEKNKEEITQLGKEFSIVTQNTSLIVLDRIEDYVEYEITPPIELQKEYFSLLKQKQQEEKDEKATVLNEALNVMNELKEWWHKRYSPLKKLVKQIEAGAPDNGVARVDSTVLQVSTERLMTAEISVNAHAVSPDSITAGLSYGFTTSNERLENSKYLLPAEIGVEFESMAVREPEEEKTSIKVNQWKADELYLKELEEIPAQKRVEKYFELKNKFSTQAAFFIDVARFFIEKNEKQFALQVLSNVAEMKLESPELLRMLANQLLEANEKELAIETFKDVMKMREEDPQSYRDLALALNEAGNYNEAIQLLYKVITEVWDTRFGDIKAIAINEMNAIISANKEIVNLSGIDNRLVYPMPMDVRIVIGWSSDNSDIDLWVTDPRNEQCLYSHNETEIGGRMSQDVTQGFGPEEFCLKTAWKGKYKVEVNLFGENRQTIGGPIAIKADLFTDFGKPAQKRETINFRVTTSKEVVELGVLKFGN
jgi:tetratricopeptide (TPR) repeat protein